MYNISLEQAKKINEIFDTFNLKQMSEQSYSIWFTSGKIYRNINHLNRDEIFNLVYQLKYNAILTDCARSVLEVSFIVDPVTRNIEIVIELSNTL